MRSPWVPLALAVALAAPACRVRLPVDRGAPPAAVERLRIEYYQISDG